GRPAALAAPEEVLSPGAALQPPSLLSSSRLTAARTRSGDRAGSTLRTSMARIPAGDGASGAESPAGADGWASALPGARARGGVKARASRTARAEDEGVGTMKIRSQCPWPTEPFKEKGVRASAREPPRVGHHRTRRSEEHTSELQSRENLVCRLLLEKKKIHLNPNY